MKHIWKRVHQVCVFVYNVQEGDHTKKPTDFESEWEFPLDDDIFKNYYVTQPKTIPALLKYRKWLQVFDDKNSTEHCDLKRICMNLYANLHRLSFFPLFDDEFIYFVTLSKQYVPFDQKRAADDKMVNWKWNSIRPLKGRLVTPFLRVGFLVGIVVFFSFIFFIKMKKIKWFSKRIRLSN